MRQMLAGAVLGALVVLVAWHASDDAPAAPTAAAVAPVASGPSTVHAQVAPGGAAPASAPARPVVEPAGTPERLLAGRTVQPWGRIRHLVGEAVDPGDPVGQSLYADLSTLHQATFDLYRSAGRDGADPVDAAALYAVHADLAERVRQSPYATAEVLAELDRVDRSLEAFR